MNMPEFWESWEGQWVNGKFPLRVWLGGSDQSAVFLTELGGQKSRKAAIKLIPGAQNDRERALTRARQATQLSHPHLLRILELGESQLSGTSFVFVVMDFADEDLFQIIPQRALTPTEVTDMLPPILEALLYLHGKGLVHGHLKPSNIFAVNNELRLSCERAYPIGNPREGKAPLTVYDAPETATDPVSPMADVWSLGVTLVEVLTQRPPVSDNLQPKDPEIPASIAEPLRSLVHDCLRRDPRQRCTVMEIQSRLRPLSVPAFVAAKVPARPQRRGRGMVIAILVLAALVGILLGYESITHQRKSVSASPNPQPEKAVPAVESPSPAAKSRKPAPAAHTSPGAVARQVLPDVPRSARDTITGKVRVTVRVEVDPSGKVTEASLTSPGPSRYFARLALQAAERWEFTVPQVDGRDVPSSWLLHFRFGRAATEVSPVQISR